jgi:hypothetical protein
MRGCVLEVQDENMMSAWCLMVKVEEYENTCEYERVCPGGAGGEYDVCLVPDGEGGGAVSWQGQLQVSNLFRHDVNLLSKKVNIFLRRVRQKFSSLQIICLAKCRM